MSDGPSLREPLLTCREAATLLGISPRTLYTFVETGRVPVVRLPGSRAIRFDREVLSESLAATQATVPNHGCA
jgi:excisionase family DNA binding protein